ncbi:MAG: hypothetical protein K8R36_01645 [Planctomycetales bacterium]|nr:hypothetical protein [Planctomycetales bacterium]
MDPKLCPFCHTWCSSNIFDQHVASHMQKLSDGQMKDHVTVRPEERFAGDIAKEPKWYVHPKCGGVTGMPEEIIRSYMADPFLYNESSFCTGCHNYVSTAELYWQETNESLQAASYRRKAEFIQKNFLNPDDFVWDAHGPVRRKSRGGSGIGLVAVFALGGVAALFLIGVVVLVGIMSVRGQAARRQAAPPINARVPAFNPAFQPAKFPDIPQVEIPKGPDINEILRESNDRMNKQIEESQKQHEKLMEDLQSRPFGPPGGLGGPPGAGPRGRSSGIEEARKRAEESRQRSQERLDALRERMRNRP